MHVNLDVTVFRLAMRAVIINFALTEMRDVMGNKPVNDVRILGNIVITPLLLARDRFNEAITNIADDLDRDGAIQRFEYCFELVWKTLKRILDHKGILVNANPRDIFRYAAKESLISDPLPWFDFLEKRNKTSHMYKEEVAVEIAAIFPEFKLELDAVVENIQKL